MKQKLTFLNNIYLLISVFLVVGIIVFLLSSTFNLFERFYAFISAYEKYNLDEIIIVSFFLFVFLFIIFLLRNKIIQRQNIKISELNADLNRQVQTKDKLYSILAHDLKNLFNSLIGFSEYIIEEYDDIADKNRKEIIAVINKISHSSFELLENLLEWTRLDSGKLTVNTKEIELSATINDTIRQIQSAAMEKKITIHSKISSKTVAYADKNMLKTIVRNLLSNAVKFSHFNSTVLVSTNKAGDFIEITISDKGIGINASRINEIFNGIGHSTPGTNNERGTGLGLQICKEFVELNHGKLRVRSTEGQGTDFIFSLPGKRQNHQSQKVEADAHYI